MDVATVSVFNNDIKTINEIIIEFKETILKKQRTRSYFSRKLS